MNSDEILEEQARINRIYNARLDAITLLAFPRLTRWQKFLLWIRATLLENK